MDGDFAMSTDVPSPQGSQEDSTEFGCWKWIFLGLIIVGAIAIGYLMLV
tara:strand:- start:1842 stop:1988 length:147 start_codon:yes stop_codon:yes gene_type:complete